MKNQLVYIVFFIGFMVFSQENPVSIAADTTIIRIGEQIQYKILVNETNNVIFPELQMDTLGRVEVVESLPTDTLKNRLEKRYLLTSFDSGQYVLPKQLILINNKKFFTDSLLVDVVKVTVDTTKQKMFPIKSIKREPKTFDDYKHLWWWIIPILLLLAVALYFILRKKKEKAAVEVYIAPLEEAMQRLVALDEKQLLQQNKIKAYYTELTDIVRTYIEKDVSIPALESTTNELIETIIDFNESSNLGIAQETIQQLKEVLHGADLVKFAKSKPMLSEIRNDRNIVEEILKNTEVAVHVNDAHHADNPIVLSEKSPRQRLASFRNKSFVIGLIVVLGLGTVGYLAYTYIKENIVGYTTSDMLVSDWYTGTYGYPPLTLETPEILKVASIQLPENGISPVGDFSMYTYGSPLSNFYIAVSTTKFISKLENIDMSAGVTSALNAMETQMETRFTNIKREDILVNGILGKKAEVEYKRTNPSTLLKNDYRLTMLFFANSEGMQQVYVSSLWSDDSAPEIVDRIIKSVYINP